MKARRRAIVTVLIAVLTLAACGGSKAQRSSMTGDSSASPATAQPSGRHRTHGSRVVFIILENHGFGQVIGNSAAPYLNGLAHHGALATRYQAITHPSLPNYLALLGGSTFGITSDCTDCKASGPNLALQLSRAGISWRAYMEDMPSACSNVSEAGGYAKKHDPFMYFPSIAEDPSRCANVVPASNLGTDLRNGLPMFSWITPNLCHDGHDCGIDVTDRYLSQLVPGLLRQLGPRGFLVVTFDEDETGGGPGGGQVATVLVGPAVRRGARVSTPYNHYSLLRTIEDAFGLPPLRRARTARPMRAAFKRFPALR
jgi:hypothetical protein